MAKPKSAVGTTTPPTLHINERSTKNNWELRYTVKLDSGKWQRKTVQTGTNDRRAAQAFMAAWSAAFFKVQAAAPRTVGEILDVYERDRRKHKVVESVFRNIENVRAYFGHMLPEEITADTLTDYAESRHDPRNGRPISASTASRETGTLRAALRLGVKRDMVDANHLPEFPKAESQPRRIFMPQDVKDRFLTAVAATSDGLPRMTRLHRFAYLGLETGARRGAIMELTWDRVDFNTGIIDFRDPAKRVTKKRRVATHMSDALLPVMKRAFKERINHLVMDKMAHLNDQWDAFRRNTEFERYYIHTMRCTFASLLVQSRVPIFEVAKLLGDTIEITNEHYAYLQPEHLKNAVNGRANGSSNHDQLEEMIRRAVKQAHQENQPPAT